MKQTAYPGLQETVFTGQTSLGLPVLVVPKPEFQKTFAQLSVNYGSVDAAFTLDGVKQDSPEGVAHFLDHKLFEQPGGENALQLFTQTGASPNAFTSHAMTAYHFECTHGFAENLGILLSFVTTPYFTPESVAKEQGIIGQEIDMTEDTPGFKLFCDFFEALYAHHPIRSSIIGTRDSIARITPDTLYACHQAFYQPSNMVLCVAGAAEPGQVMDMAEAALKPGGRPASLTRAYGPLEAPTPVKTRTARKMSVASPLFMVGAKVSVGEGAGQLRQELVYELACETLAGSSSPLYERLYAEGIVNKQYEYGPYRFPGGQTLLFSGESPNPEAFRDALMQELNRVRQNGLDEALFTRIKKAALGGRVWGLDSPSRLCRDLAAAHFLGENCLDFPEWFASITVEQAANACLACLTEDKLALAVIEPL